MNDFRHFIPIVIGTVVSTSMMGAEPDLATTNATFGQTVTFGSLPTGIWQGEVGEGFRSSAQTLSIEAGDAAGFQAFGGRRITIWLWPASHTATCYHLSRLSRLEHVVMPSLHGFHHGFIDGKRPE